ncbi:uncharacterized protein LOC107882576 [Acyrthosiphon pisum]|uniref:Uncharacterized protein n=1 Tax=Acyrthosiphon pisum TaxID=7029 RepID=A0A8R2H5M7_ACYPI|nr:uncharacterized protein LOC107882576 [Acyrthosiphon pisum]|eukprot:XP_016656625.1 PREDICTED: uncharacterized protein LOC107882576 [Acyrthosiphon pisum]
MSVLMFFNNGDEESWPSDEAIERYRNQNAGDGRAVKVFDYRTGPPSIVDAVDREFRLSGHHGHGVRLVLTGYRDPALARWLYRERGLPVNVIFSSVDIADGSDWSESLWSDDGITMSGWNCSAGIDDNDDDLDIISHVLRFVNDLCYDYRRYARGLRNIPSVATAEVDSTQDGVYASIMDTFGKGVQAVEPVLDAILEQLCGAARADSAATDDGRWTLASGVVEEGDRAAEDAARLVSSSFNCSAAAALDYTKRTTRVAASFASTFWHKHAKITPTHTDRTLAACLTENLRAVADPELAELSAEHFDMCLNAKFIATRRWRWTVGGASSVAGSATAVGPSLFRPEIRQRCERFLAVDHLQDLMAAGDDVAGKHFIIRSHVEHLEPHVLPQRLVDYASTHFDYEVRYFALTDKLVFRFTDGGRGRFVEQSHLHRFAGPTNFKEFHNEAFRTIDFKSGNYDAGRPLAMTDPNVFRYRAFGYVDASDYAVHYVSVTGDTEIRAEVYELRDDDSGSSVLAGEQRYRMKVECGEFWVTIHSAITASSGERQTELTVGLTDGTVVAVTRLPSGDFVVTPRNADSLTDDHSQRYVWPDGRPVFEFFDDVVTVISADGTCTSADFGQADHFVCVTYLSDGAKVRMTMTRPVVQFCQGSESGEPVTDDKYLVCRRDLSGYEFVNHHKSRRTVCQVREGSDHETPWPVTVVRTLTQNRFDDRMAELVDKALADHLITIKTLADRLNAVLPVNDDDVDDELDELDELNGETSLVSHPSVNM